MFYNSPPLSEEEVYFLYKLINATKLTQKKLINFEFLRPVGWSVGFVGFHLIRYSKSHQFRINGFIFHNKLFKQYNPDDYQKFVNQKRTLLRPEIAKFVNGIPDFSDFVAFELPFNPLCNWIEFDPEVIGKEKLAVTLKKYLTHFSKDKFGTGNSRIILPSLQLQIAKDKFIELFKLHGESFVVNLMDFKINENEQINIIHVMLILELQGYLKILDLQILDWDKNPDNQKEEYKIWVELTSKLTKQPFKGSKTSLLFDFKGGAFYLDDLNQPLHVFQDNSIVGNIFKKAFANGNANYEIRHDYSKTQRERHQQLFNDFRRNIKIKLKGKKVKSKLMSDFLIGIKGGNIEISKSIEVYNKPSNVN